jgi:hypothetical protein
MPKSPSGLKAEGRRLWREITGTYELRADELRLLEDACREIDVIDRVQQALDSPDGDLMVKGSQGQLVASPLLQELRQHRTVLRHLFAALRLPEEGAGEDRSAKARAAVNERWRRSA